MSVLGWWFCRELRLPHGDGREVRDGETLHVDEPIGLCYRGLHASRQIMDALRYAPGPIVCRVELSGHVVEGDDKAAATHRKCLWHIDATPILHEFACRCAEQALGYLRQCGIKPDPRSLEAIEMKRRWLRGEATDEELEAAEVAARDVIEDAAKAAVEVAGSEAWDAYNAAVHVAGAAAWGAVSTMVWDTAWEAAWDTAWAATSAAASLATYIDTDVVKDEAYAAAKDAQNAELERLVREAAGKERE